MVRSKLGLRPWFRLRRRFRLGSRCMGKSSQSHACYKPGAPPALVVCNGYNGNLSSQVRSYLI